jgi:TPR repeat protein
MTLKDLLKRHKPEGQPGIQPESSAQAGQYGVEGQQPRQDVPEFTFMRTTTSTQEIITPPSYPGDRASLKPVELNQSSPRRRSRFRRHSNAAAQDSSAGENRASLESTSSRHEKRLSDRLHLSHRSRSASSSSVNIPEDLPEIEGHAGQDEEKWEKRATILAKNNPNQESGLERPATPHRTPSREEIVEGDDDIQEAIRLHEEGDLTKSTEMFGRLADPNGANNALSQVLYGLALRHGWGIAKDEAKAVTYLSHAASNSADIEALALQAGMKKGGTAKGELTLAIFELANCFRNGWGVKRDPVAAKQYYETAANMGDTDAMNEVAWCYLEGFGCKKDKVRNSWCPGVTHLPRIVKLGAKKSGGSLPFSPWSFFDRNVCKTTRRITFNLSTSEKNIGNSALHIGHRFYKAN